jgi:hypothetical protein
MADGGTHFPPNDRNERPSALFDALPREELLEWRAFAWDHRDETDSARIVALVDALLTPRRTMCNPSPDKSLRLRAVIDRAVEALCALAEEVQPADQELADRIWDLTNEHLELAVQRA